MKYSIEDLDNALSIHDNPEVSRQFSPQKWLKSREFLAQLARQDWLRCPAQKIHIAGSNGKGSTAFYLNMLAENNFPEQKTGLYTSPHLTNVTERITVDSIPISVDDAMHNLEEIKSNIDRERYQQLSWFEIMTILALLTFKKSKCSIVFLEAGLGGRLDATRMAAGDTLVLTRICKEHSNILGNTINEIAAQKLGLITDKTNNVFILDDPNDSSYKQKIKKIIDTIALNNSVVDPKIHFFSCKNPVHYLEENQKYAQFIFNTLFYSTNQKIRINNPDFPPGRLELRKIDSNLQLVFDTAHNIYAINQVLADLIKKPLFPGKDNCLIIIGISKDRKINPFIKAIQLAGFTNITWMYEKPQFEKKHSAKNKILKSDISEHCQTELKKQKKPNWIVFLGSHNNYPQYQLLYKSLLQKQVTK